MGKTVVGFIIAALVAGGAQAQPATADTQITLPESSADAAKRQAEQQRTADEDQRRQQDDARRRADEDQRRQAEDQKRQQDDARRKADEDQRKQAEDQRRQQDDARRRADEDQRRQADEQRRRTEQERKQEDEAKRTAQLKKAGAKKDAPNCSDHPLFTRLQDYWIESCAQKPLDAHNFDAGKRRNMVQGRYWYIRYQPPAGLAAKPSTLQLLRDAAAIVENAGAQVVASDSSKKTLELTRDGKELWVEVWADHLGKYILTIVEKAAR